MAGFEGSMNLNQENTSISIIVCTYLQERWDDLISVIESLKRQTVKPDEIIVVVDHNPALLEQVRNEINGVLTVENQGLAGASAARNSGVAASKGEILAFIDDDAEAFPNWLENMLTGFESAEVLGVGGEMLPKWLEIRPRWFPNEFNWVVGATYKGFPEEAAPVRNLWTGNMSVRREVFEKIHGFRVGFGKVGLRSSPEDTDFCIRAIQDQPQRYWLYRPEARVWHKVPALRSNWDYFLLRCYNEGYGKAYLAQLVGAQQGLSNERIHMLKAIPAGVLKGLAEAILRRDLSGLERAGAIIVGLTMTVYGFIRGTIDEHPIKLFRHQPVQIEQ
jgi:GT2 family glycosyltransferase